MCKIETDRQTRENIISRNDKIINQQYQRTNYQQLALVHRSLYRRQDRNYRLTVHSKFMTAPRVT